MCTSYVSVIGQVRDVTVTQRLKEYRMFFLCLEYLGEVSDPGYQQVARFSAVIQEPRPLPAGVLLFHGVQAAWLPGPRCNQEETQRVRRCVHLLRAPAPNIDHLLASHC